MLAMAKRPRCELKRAHGDPRTRESPQEWRSHYQHPRLRADARSLFLARDTTSFHRSNACAPPLGCDLFWWNVSDRDQLLCEPVWYRVREVATLLRPGGTQHLAKMRDKINQRLNSWMSVARRPHATIGFMIGFCPPSGTNSPDFTDFHSVGLDDSIDNSPSSISND